MKTLPKKVQLEGGDLDKMQALTDRIEKDLLKLSDKVLTHMYGREHGHSVKSLCIVPNNVRIAILNSRAQVIGVWEKPPGVCRAARKGEKFD